MLESFWKSHFKGEIILYPVKCTRNGWKGQRMREIQPFYDGVVWPRRPHQKDQYNFWTTLSLLKRPFFPWNMAVIRPYLNFLYTGASAGLEFFLVEKDICFFQVLKSGWVWLQTEETCPNISQTVWKNYFLTVYYVIVAPTKKLLHWVHQSKDICVQS